MQKMTLDNIHEWPLMTRLLLLVLVFFIVLYLGYRFDLSSQIQSLSKAAQQESDLKQQLELVITKNKMIQEEVTHLPGLQTQLVSWEKQLVDYNDLPELLNQILKIGGDNHLFFSLFTPGEPVRVEVNVGSDTAQDGGSSAAPATAAPANAAAETPDAQRDVIAFSKVPIKVVVVGNYHQLADFISQIANLPWIVAVGNFTISNESQSALLGEAMAKQAATQHLLTAELQLEIYNAPKSK